MAVVAEWQAILYWATSSFGPPTKHAKAGAYVYGNPTNWVDPLGLILYYCDRPAFGADGWLGNHAYPWDPATGRNEGQGGSSGRGETTTDENPRDNDDSCDPIPGTEGLEDEILDEMREHANDGPWFPFFNDCHSAVQDSLERHGVSPISSPNGRIGRSNPGSPKPPPNSPP